MSLFPHSPAALRVPRREGVEIQSELGAVEVEMTSPVSSPKLS
ncbi:hypothetical protein [Amycolatopsis sp. lyj-90]